LPKKEQYYRPDLAIILGMTEHQVRYAVSRGRIPKGSGLDEWGRSFWTEEDLEALLDDKANKSTRWRDTTGHTVVPRLEMDSVCEKITTDSRRQGIVQV